MITLVEVLGFRCLRDISRPLDRFQILVGPNASGKTTFLDVFPFLSELVTSGPEAAFRQRTRNPLDLLWGRQSGTLEFALEAKIPSELSVRERPFDTFRYEIAVSVDPETYEPTIRAEQAFFTVTGGPAMEQTILFPETHPPPRTLLHHLRRNYRLILKKTPEENDLFNPEGDSSLTADGEESWTSMVSFFTLGPRRSALGNLPSDESRFPVTTWFKELLGQGVQRIVLNSLLLRQASPPGQGRSFRPDGSNLPWVVHELREKYPSRFRDWLAHVGTALPELEDIRVVVREDDKHAYLVIRYSGGLDAPSWVVSDGTLRLLALTILAYVPMDGAIFLIEEPENGIHPTAVETVFQSLESVYTGQVLVASHSPVLLSIAKPSQLLCFSKSSDGSTDIVRGDAHPALLEWRGEVPLGAFFASGVLG